MGGCAENADQLAELERVPGCSGVKVFMGSSTGSLLVADDATLDRVLRSIRRRMAVHCEDEPRLIERRSVITATGATAHPGQIVSRAEASGVGLEDLSLAEMQSVEPRITQAVFSVLSVENSVASRRSFGGTSPENVAAAARAWLNRLEAKAQSR
jgi:dihydroorotase-like cyclic amidohydrolase